MTKLSFVIPVYNMQDYIGRCLDSLLNQNIPHSEYEIIVINDGSSDNSLLILSDFVENHSNIHLINQSNKGISATRNAGLKAASGKYIWHIDSDDWIIENCLKGLLEICETDDLDMLEVAPSVPTTSNFAVDVIINACSEIYSGIELLINKKAVISAWAYIVKRDFLVRSNLQFLTGILNEDNEFTPRALYFAQKVRLMHFSVYHYFQREGSTVYSFSEDRLFQYIAIAHSLKEFAQTEVKERNIKNIFISNANGFFLATVSAIAKYNFSGRTVKSVLEHCKKYRVYPLPIEFSSIPRLLIVLVVNFSPVAYINFLKRCKYNKAVE